MNGVHETPRHPSQNSTDPAEPQPTPRAEPHAPSPEAVSSDSAASASTGPDAADPAAVRTGAEPGGPQDPAAPESGSTEPGDDETTEETAALPAEFYRCADERTRRAGIDAARRELARHQVVVMPTDTVYGIAANAFSAQGVRRLLEAKGRDRTMPPPVLIAHTGVLDGLADEISDEARALAAAFWPGGLTLICRAQPSLQWDLGETHGTVGLRVPDDEIARAMLSETGPLAVSSANRTGMPAATTAEQAREMLGDTVRVYLEAGPRTEGRDPDPSAPAPAPVSSTIVDCTGATPVVVRDGQISLTRLREIVPSVLALDGSSALGAVSAAPAPETGAPAEAAAHTEHVQPAQDVASGSTAVGTGTGAPGAETPGTGAVAASEAAEQVREPAPPDPEAEIVEEERAERKRAEPEPGDVAADFSAAAPAGASTAAAVVAAGGRSAADRGAPVPDQDRSRPTSSTPAGRTRPLGLAEASALVAFGTRDEPVIDGADAAGESGETGVDQQR